MRRMGIFGKITHTETREGHEWSHKRAKAEKKEEALMAGPIEDAHAHNEKKRKCSDTYGRSSGSGQRVGLSAVKQRRNNNSSNENTTAKQKKENFSHKKRRKSTVKRKMPLWVLRQRTTRT